MATYDDFDGVYFTVQAMRLSHPEVMGETSFLVLDNNPEGASGEALRHLAGMIPGFRYLPFQGYQGTAVRDLLFREADADIVMCVDPHVLLRPGGVRAMLEYFDGNNGLPDIVQGPLLDDSLDVLVATHMKPTWGAGMYGQWATDDRVHEASGLAFEIPMQGLGVFACRRTDWPGINPRFRGFGGEEGYLHEKFRQNGGRAICLPALAWAHRFQRPAGVPYSLDWQDRIRNYHVGWAEVGWDTAEIDAHIHDHFKSEEAPDALGRARAQVENPLMFFDAILCSSSEAEPERWREMSSGLARLGVAWRVERVSAQAAANPAQGLVLSFRSMIATARERGYESVLIVSDDVTFSDHALTILAAGVRSLESREWDLLSLEGTVATDGEAPSDIADALAIATGLTGARALAVKRTAYDRLLIELPAEAGERLDVFVAEHQTLDRYLDEAISQERYRALATLPAVVLAARAPCASGAAGGESRDGAGDTVTGSADVVLLLVGFGVGISVLDRSSLAIADRLAALMPAELIAAAGSSVQLEYVVDTSEDGGISVSAGGQLCCRFASAEEALAWLRPTIDGEIALRARTAAFVHAGVVAWRGHAILIPGRSHTGKSSLVTALVAEGAVYYSDDYAPIDTAGRVHPYARVPSLRGEAGATARYVERPLRTRARLPLPVAMIVSTSFHAGAAWQPRAQRGASAILPLLDNVILAREQPRLALRVAARVAAGSVTLSGPRPEADEVARPILARLNALLDGEPVFAGEETPAIASRPPGPGIEPPAAERSVAIGDLVRRMRMEAWTAEVLRAFSAAGVRPILLKGPATVRWLYATDPHRRTYNDADLLVAPHRLRLAREVLGGLGFAAEPQARLEVDRHHAVNFVREADGASVDLHHTMHGMIDVPPDRVWAAAQRDAASLVVGGARVAVLGPAMGLLHIALHLGPRDGPDDRAWIDLSRAFALTSREQWEEALDLAEELGITHELAARLRRRAEAAWLIERLGPQPPAPRYLLGGAVDAGRAPMAVLSIDRLVGAGDLWSKARYVRDKLAVAPDELFPAGALVFEHSGSLRLGRVAHAAAVAFRFPAALAAWRRERDG